MKKVFLLLLLSLMTFQGVALAHPPSDISAAITGTKVDVTVKHSVADPKNHYIKEIDIAISGNKPVNQNFYMQTDNTKQTASFNIPSLKKGDKITVRAICSISGDRKKDFTAK